MNPIIKKILIALALLIGSWLVVKLAFWLSEASRGWW